MLHLIGFADFYAEATSKVPVLLSLPPPGIRGLIEGPCWDLILIVIRSSFHVVPLIERRELDWDPEITWFTNSVNSSLSSSVIQVQTYLHPLAILAQADLLELEWSTVQVLHLIKFSF